MSLVGRIHDNRYFARFIPTLDYCLQKALRDCESVIDLGCGPASPIRHCPWVKDRVGVEAHAPYLAESRAQNIHNKYIQSDILSVDFPEKSVDAVILIEVIEHLPKEAGLALLKKAERWARKKVILSTPNGFYRQQAIDGDKYQEHLSGWDSLELRSLGFTVNGLAGLRCLRRPFEGATQCHDITKSMRFRPKILWFAITSLSQIITYRFARFAFELFAVKTIKK